MTMNEYKISVKDGKSKVLHTAGKYCDRNIIIEGVGALYDSFWDVFQQDGSNKYNPIQGVFNGGRFTADNFYPKYDIRPVGSAAYLFYAWETETNPGHTALDLKQRLADCGVVLDTSEATSIDNMFAYARVIDNIPTIDCTGLTSACSRVFAAANALTKIEKLIVNDTVSYNAWFNSCNNLISIQFEGVIGKSISFGWSTMLSYFSVRSIIDHLKDLTGQARQTLTLPANIVQSMDEELKIAITAKNWELVY